jgi:hypothetical protein
MAFYGSEELEGIFEDPELFSKSSKGGRSKPSAWYDKDRHDGNAERLQAWGERVTDDLRDFPELKRVIQGGFAAYTAENVVAEVHGAELAKAKQRMRDQGQPAYKVAIDTAAGGRRFPAKLEQSVFTEGILEGMNAELRATFRAAKGRRRRRQEEERVHATAGWGLQSVRREGVLWVEDRMLAVSRAQGHGRRREQAQARAPQAPAGRLDVQSVRREGLLWVEDRMLAVSRAQARYTGR